MPGAGNLKKDLLLALEQDFPVVEAAGEKHQPVDLDQLLAGESLVGLLRLLALVFEGSPGRFGLCLNGGHQSPWMFLAALQMAF